MSEVPKKIWIEPEDQELGWWEDGEVTDTLYIHGDLVAELADALEFYCAVLESTGKTALKGRDALAALQEKS